MSLTPEQYLALSSLAYESFQSQLLGDPEKSRIDKVTKNIDTSKPEFNVLSSLSSWTLVNTYASPSGMSAIATSVTRYVKNLFNRKGNCYV